jgi:hypothetical protein
MTKSIDLGKKLGLLFDNWFVHYSPSIFVRYDVCITPIECKFPCYEIGTIARNAKIKHRESKQAANSAKD